MAVKTREQEDLFQERLTDRPLEKLLERRQDAKDEVSKLQSVYAEADKKAKERLTALALAEGTYRCGRFLITTTERPAREVSFETKAAKVTRIKLLDS